MSVKPLLKWLGGKTQLLPHLLPKFPERFRNYIEPFVGGGSVLFEVCSKIRSGELECTGTIFASDVNPILISFYTCVQNSVHELLTILQTLESEYNQCTGDTINRQAQTKREATGSKESYYYYIRFLFNQEPLGTIQKSAYFYFLNKTCFRGVYREGPRGFNVPFGNYNSISIAQRDYLLEVSNLIQPVQFVCQSFTELFSKKWSRKDFIYFDPPYVPVETTSFTDYTTDGFKKEQHLLLFDWCVNLKAAGIPFLLSNSDTELVRTSFPQNQFEIEELNAKRSIHSKRPQTRTTELLIW